MANWRERVAKLREGEGERANSANSANSPPEPVKVGPNGTNGTNGKGSLPAAVQLGLQNLGAMRRPRITRPEVWAEIVADAARIAGDGWAATALGLGWHPLELWGCSLEPGGAPEFDGLSVWLRGRKLLLIDDMSAIVANHDGARACYNRKAHDGAGYLWEMGR